MYQPRVFCVKIQLHFGGDIYEISVPAYDGAEPTVTDLMNVVERDYRVPRALQNLVFHGQELHQRLNEPLSRFGIKNGAAVRLVGRMVPPDMVPQINAQFNPYPYQQSYPPVNSAVTFHTTEQSLPYYHAQAQQQYPNATVGTQYDPPGPPPQSASSVKSPAPGTPNKESTSERANGSESKPPATPK